MNTSPAGGGLTPALDDRASYQASPTRCIQRVPVCAMTGNYSNASRRLPARLTMIDMPTFEEALRRQREVFADRYKANPELDAVASEIDAMFADDEAEPVTSYAARRGE